MISSQRLAAAPQKKVDSKKKLKKIAETEQRAKMPTTGLEETQSRVSFSSTSSSSGASETNKNNAESDDNGLIFDISIYKYLYDYLYHFQSHFDIFS